MTVPDFLTACESGLTLIIRGIDGDLCCDIRDQDLALLIYHPNYHADLIQERAQHIKQWLEQDKYRRYYYEESYPRCGWLYVIDVPQNTIYYFISDNEFYNLHISLAMERRIRQSLPELDLDVMRALGSERVILSPWKSFVTNSTPEGLIDALEERGFMLDHRDSWRAWAVTCSS